MLLPNHRVEIVQYCRRMQADGLTVGTSGNISVRSGDHIAITPTGVAYENLTAASICVVDLEGRPVEEGLMPSSEVPMHTSVYAQTDAVAVVHTHPLYATALSTLVDELPAVHYMVALLGGPVRVAPYATYGSVELADNSVRAMEGRFGVILQNHGATTYGDSLAAAYTRSIYLEWLCRLYHQARLLGEPHILPPEEIERVGRMLGSYGPAPGPPPAVPRPRGEAADDPAGHR
ncbi:class II aldolase/adducin family protein [Pseudonocardia xinjiangensis]|uniref:Class II aldolase/adducin family protein n=1 Tax=Pseudonocardia xinjiangensis TaxID=75289 RepID=A0ABX1RI36_9PSEU|nr:class II aldolase/adducin family protein [Pseudonocardia xinjiangensis]NMH79060.1 class II aldolase/adducin family protein [Pseudonocardia xinjiangensis]